jgi:hypothetical protein
MTQAQNRDRLSPTAQKAQVPEEAQTDSKTRALAKGVEGYEAQNAQFTPPSNAGAQQKAPASGATETSVGKTEAKVEPSKVDAAAAGDTSTTEANPETLSPIREALLKQFELMDGKGVGDKEFDTVCSADTWKKEKDKERIKRQAAEAKFARDMAEYEDACARNPDYKKTHPKPRKDIVPVYTTCIDTTNAVARAAWKASGMAVKRIEGKKYDQFAFGANSRVEGQKLGAWVESRPKLGQTPKPGDMLMLEKAGETVDKATAEKSYKEVEYANSKKTLEKELANLEAASKQASSALATACAARVPTVVAALEKLKSDYDAAKVKVQTKVKDAEAALAKRVEGGAKLEFSHVGFFKSSTDEIGDDGKATGRQIWTTFDGGQSQVAGTVDGQGAKAGKRYYDPNTNMISGEASQGGAARWLAGWIDIDKMAKPKEGEEEKR